MPDQESVLRYQDFVIKDGKLVGDFEGLYKNFEDPWHQSREDHLFDTRRALALLWSKHLRREFGCNRVIELGCGFGYLTENLREEEFYSLGTDISPTAIDKAREINPQATFEVAGLSDFHQIIDFNPDILLMAELTWYVLDELDVFISNLKAYSEQRNKPTYLIHILTTYAPGVQKYGKEKFTNLEEIKNYFEMNYLESGFILTPRVDDPLSQGTYFVAEI